MTTQLALALDDVDDLAQDVAHDALIDDARLPPAFWRRVVEDRGCWRWIGPRDKDGYGKHGSLLAHRMSYAALVGVIPEKLVLDHALFPQYCIGPGCVRPEHLSPVTPLANTMRGSSPPAENARRMTCAKGHRYMAVRNRRTCYTCSNAQKREARRRRMLGLF
jgi:hypothetical protein